MNETGLDAILAPSNTQVGYDFAMVRSLPPAAGDYARPVHRWLFIDGRKCKLKRSKVACCTHKHVDLLWSLS